jgi:hypothetical protein
MVCAHLVGIRVVELDGGELRVVEAAVHGAHREAQVVRLVRLERAGDGEVCRVVSVEHVHQLRPVPPSTALRLNVPPQQPSVSMCFVGLS